MNLFSVIYIGFKIRMKLMKVDVAWGLADVVGCPIPTYLCQFRGGEASDLGSDCNFLDLKIKLF